jgi:lipoate-protein ligase A
MKIILPKRDLSGDGKKIRNSCFLSVKKKVWNHHLIFWSIGTLTGLRVWIKRLIVDREDISSQVHLT